MRIKIFTASLAILLSFAATTPLLAQTLNQGGPTGPIGWSSSAVLCHVLPGAAHQDLDYIHGTVTFTSTSYGRIGYVCSVPGIMNRLTPGDINDFAFSFSNPSAQSGGCTISVDFLDSTTSLTDTWTTGESLSGLWTANIPLVHTYPLTDHAYDIRFYLNRPQSAVNVCNPVAYAAFMEEIIF
jgi:hypothetical protein